MVADHAECHGCSRIFTAAPVAERNEIKNDGL